MLLKTAVQYLRPKLDLKYDQSGSLSVLLISHCMFLPKTNVSEAFQAMLIND